MCLGQIAVPSGTLWIRSRRPCFHVRRNFVRRQFPHNVILNVALCQEYIFTGRSIRVLESWYLYITRHLRILLLRMFSFALFQVCIAQIHV